MKQFLTIILIFFFAVAFSQRDKPVFDKRTDADKFITAVEDLSQRDNLVMLLPGNWENASGAVLYYWLDNNEPAKGPSAAGEIMVVTLVYDGSKVVASYNFAK